MLAMRLQPVGKKGQRTFRVVVAESRSKLGGRPTDRVGHYNPFTKELKVDEEKTLQWLQNGAQPSRTVHNLLVSAGVIEGAKIPVAIPERTEPQINEEAPTQDAEQAKQPTEEVAGEGQATPEEPSEAASGDADEPAAETQAEETEETEEAEGGEEEAEAPKSEDVDEPKEEEDGSKAADEAEQSDSEGDEEKE